MKTKEIDVWINGYNSDTYDNFTTSEIIANGWTEQYGLDVYKAKLIIQIPEKLYQVTDTQIDMSFNDWHRRNMSTSDLKELIKKNLSGDI